jgi:hypothetical protein
MSVRFTWLISALNWNCAAAYSADWDDALTQGEPLIRTPETVTVTSDVTSGLFSDGTETINLHGTDARFLCAIHGWHAVLTDWVPGAASTLLPVLTGFGLNIGQLGYRDDIGQCFEGVEDGGDADVICLEAIAQNECYSPATMGQIIGRQLAEYARTDGKMCLEKCSFHLISQLTNLTIILLSNMTYPILSLHRLEPGRQAQQGRHDVRGQLPPLWRLHRLRAHQHSRDQESRLQDQAQLDASS